MKRGYVRYVQGRTVKEQEEDMLAAGVSAKAIYQDKSPDDAIASLRDGDELVVSGGLRVLANSRRGIREYVDAVHAKGAFVFDFLTGRRTDKDGVAMLDDAVSDIAGFIRGGHIKSFAKMGGKARWKESQEARMAQREALIIWRDPSLSTKEAIGQMTGWTQANAYRILGRRNVGAGPVKGRGRDDNVIRGRVYFVQRPGNKRIKIGFTTNMVSRLNGLATDEKLEVLLTIPGTLELEKAMHERFKEYRVKGEWFEPGDKLLKFIDRKLKRRK